jgi:hypothetical protein
MSPELIHGSIVKPVGAGCLQDSSLNFPSTACARSHG